MGPEHSIFLKKISSDPNVKLELKTTILGPLSVQIASAFMLHDV